MAAVGSGATDVVDRARGVRDEVGEVGDLLDRREHEPGTGPRRPE